MPSRIAPAPATQTPSTSRSDIMRAVKDRDTGPEMIVRRMVHSMGYRYRLHRKDLPGKPDLVFAPRKKIIFVNGCFWHGHACPRGARTPKTNRAYWQAKIKRTIARDAEHSRKLGQLKWDVLTVWECELKDKAVLRKRLQRFLEQH